MAREQWHRWGQTAVTIITLVFVCGITYSNISHNTTDISRNTNKVEDIEEDIHAIQINQAEKIATDKAIAATLIELKVGMDSIRVTQNEIKLDVNSTKIKIDTLIKD